MGELAVSSTPGEELVAVGLGSCIGLVLIDRQSGTAGLAHILLPDSQGKPGPTGKFADLAVPQMVETLVRAGAVRRRLEAVMVGGARMFAVAKGSLEIGERNTEAVRAALSKERIRVVCERTGGARGRTVTVLVNREVNVREAGGESELLLKLAPEPRGTRAEGARLSPLTASVRPHLTGAKP